MIKVDNISYAYNEQTEISFPEIKLESGEHALILGQSGCGKTTLLHLLAGLLTPKTGSVEIDQIKLASLGTTEMDAFRGNNIGVIFQKPHFIKALSVVENVEIAQSLGGKVNRSEAIKTLTTLGLGHKIKSRVTDLSEGEKQRVSIARALINNPKIILADEPTSALDDNNCNAVLGLLKDIAEKAGSTLIVVTHDNRLKDKFEKRIEL